MTINGPSAPVASGASYTISAVSGFTGPNPPTTYIYKNGQLVASGMVSASYSSSDVGPATITYSASSSYGSATKVVTILAPNGPPTISDISNKTTPEDTATGAIAFTIGDAHTSAAQLVVTATSSVQSVLLNSGIAHGGSGANRTIVASPVPNAHGTTTVTVTVSDGVFTASDSFLLTVTPVADPATISSVSNRTILEDASTGAIAFTVSDVDVAPAQPGVTFASTNATLFPAGAIALGGSGSSRTVTATPAANQSGLGTITLTVGSGAAAAATSFVVTVTPVDDAPTISSVSSRTIAMGGTTGAIAFTIGDVDTPIGNLVVTRNSSNPTLVPNGNVALGGSGASRTVTVTPVAGLQGSTVITLTVGYGSISVPMSFSVHVTMDFDADGIPNAVESLIGSDPHAANSLGSVPALSIESPTQ